MRYKFNAKEYNFSSSWVIFRTADEKLQSLYDRCEEACIRNLAVFTDKKVLREGSDYDGVWLETQPMGGEMYAKRNIEVALNNQLIFMENQRPSGRLPGMIKYGQPFLLQVFYDWLQGFCFPEPALRMYYLIGHDQKYLVLLQHCLKAFDEYLWEYRDSDHDGCLETWCTWDTGEDYSERFAKYNIPDGGWGGERAPSECGLPFASMDVMSYSFSAEKALSEIGRILQDGSDKYWKKKASCVREKIHSYLWREDRGACYDRNASHAFMDTLIHNNLRCMYYGSFTQKMADRFVHDHLMNTREFWTPVPLPSIAANDPCFRNISSNNWSGQPEGLTYQRAIDALENYGHRAEMVLLGKKWTGLLIRTGRLVQQYDPFTGEPCHTRSGNKTDDPGHRYQNVSIIGPDGYGPTVLAALEYISRLCGVYVKKDTVLFSAASDMAPCSYTQHILGHNYTLEQDGEQAEAFVDGVRKFTFTPGAAILCSLDGSPVHIFGISEHAFCFAMKGIQGSSSACIKTLLHPNEEYDLQPSIHGIRQVPFAEPWTPE